MRKAIARFAFAIAMTSSAIASESHGQTNLSRQPSAVAKSKLTVAAVNQEGERRCGYLGYWGSFHLIGDRGTAAYQIGRDKFIADLVFSKEDNNFWMYTPTKGDASTKMWAFARRPDRCGRSWVWRFSEGSWKRYESTRAWGEGFGEELKSASVDVIDQVNRRIDRVNERLKKLDGLDE